MAQTEPTEIVIKLDSQARTSIRALTRAINGLTLALKQVGADASLAEEAVKRLSEDLTPEAET